MTCVFGTKRLSQPLTLQSPDSLEEAATGFSLATHVGQNQDGTWDATQQTQTCNPRPKKRKAEGPPMPPTQRRGPPRLTALQMSAHVLKCLEDVSNTTDPENGGGRASSPDMGIAPRLRVQKRKADDKDHEDYVPVSADL
jgi:hypothetical protein